MAHDVFISYSSKDKNIADAVCAKLEGRKVRCWIAPRDILPGVEYGQALVEGIKNSKVVVLVFSANSNVSPQVMREIERAVSNEIPIIPLRIENILPSESMEYYLSSVHWLDALTPPIEKHLDRLAETVALLLEQKKAPLPNRISLEIGDTNKGQIFTSDTKRAPRTGYFRLPAWAWGLIGVVLMGVIFSAFRLFHDLAGSPAAQTVTPTLTIQATEELIALPLHTNTPTLEIPTATFTPTFQPTETPVLTAVLTSNANIRSGPGTNYAILTTLNSGMKIEIKGRSKDGKWLVFTLPENRHGWIAVSIVQVDFKINSLPEVEAPPPPTTAPATATHAISIQPTIITLAPP